MKWRPLALSALGIVALALIGGGLWWWQSRSTAPTPAPRYRPVVQTPLKTDDPAVRAVLVVLQLGSGEDLLRVVRHYLQGAPQADFYQIIAPEGSILALRTATFSDPEKLPKKLRARLDAWQRVMRAGREGPYTLYLLEKYEDGQLKGRGRGLGLLSRRINSPAQEQKLAHRVIL